ncbi:MAG TPA: hypothetical protein VGO93_18090 [Candidatus Xenobia bacterium]|jgi:hypothetical protein
MNRRTLLGLMLAGALLPACDRAETPATAPGGLSAQSQVDTALNQHRPVFLEFYQVH